MIARDDLLDANVWLALSAADHPQHQRARRYWHEESGDRLAFCRVTMLALLRLVTTPVVMDGLPLSVGEVWQVYRAWLRRDDVTVVREPTDCDALLDGWLSRNVITPRLWTDAYLAAFARAGALRLVSFDRDFVRFDGVDLLHLESPP
ncbi:MAG: TA system VapC family ribonuclease toxin [Dehalococcoidia bacterium]